MKYTFIAFFKNKDFKLVLIFILILFDISCINSEINKNNNKSELNSNSLYNSTIVSNNPNELYFGVENIIKVFTPGVSNAYILLEYQNGNGGRKENGAFYITPNSFNNVTIILNNIQTKERKEFVFKVKNVPSLVK